MTRRPCPRAARSLLPYAGVQLLSRAPLYCADKSIVTNAPCLSGWLANRRLAVPRPMSSNRHPATATVDLAVDRFSMNIFAPLDGPIAAAFARDDFATADT